MTLIEQIEKYISENGRNRYGRIKKENIWKDIVAATNHLPDNYHAAQRIWHLKSKCYKINPGCAFCGKDVIFNKHLLVYNTTCSAKCHRHHCMDQIRETNIRKYGGPSPMSSAKVRERVGDSTMINHGVRNISSSAITKEKKMKKAMERYGVDNVSRAPCVRKKISDYRQGLTDDEQRIIIAKQLLTAKKPRFYTMPSGKVANIQGYEHWALDELLLSYDEDRIGIHATPTIRFELNGQKKRHYPDIYIADENRLIEVKSDFTYDKYIELNMAKKEAAIADGFLYEFWVYTQRGIKTVK